MNERFGRSDLLNSTLGQQTILVGLDEFRVGFNELELDGGTADSSEQRLS